MSFVKKKGTLPTAKEIQSALEKRKLPKLPDDIVDYLNGKCKLTLADRKP